MLFVQRTWPPLPARPTQSSPYHGAPLGHTETLVVSGVVLRVQALPPCGDELWAPSHVGMWATGLVEEVTGTRPAPWFALEF